MDCFAATRKFMEAWTICVMAKNLQNPKGMEWYEYERGLIFRMLSINYL